MPNQEKNFFQQFAAGAVKVLNDVTKEILTDHSEDGPSGASGQSLQDQAQRNANRDCYSNPRKAGDNPFN